MLIRHPDSARGNDLYATPEVATLALLVRLATDIEIEQLEIIEGGTLHAPPAASCSRSSSPFRPARVCARTRWRRMASAKQTAK